MAADRERTPQDERDTADRDSGDAEHAEVIEELREVLHEKEQEDPITAREAFELEAEELGLSEEAGEIGEQS